VSKAMKTTRAQGADRFVVTEHAVCPQAAAPAVPMCETCPGQPATCIGRYEDMTSDGYGCDGCCGHGCEDGECRQLYDEEGIEDDAKN